MLPTLRLRPSAALRAPGSLARPAPPWAGLGPAAALTRQSEVPGRRGRGGLSREEGRETRVGKPAACPPPPRLPRPGARLGRGPPREEGGSPGAEEAEGRFSFRVWEVRPSAAPCPHRVSASGQPARPLHPHGLQAAAAPGRALGPASAVPEGTHPRTTCSLHLERGPHSQRPECSPQGLPCPTTLALSSLFPGALL